MFFKKKKDRKEKSWNYVGEAMKKIWEEKLPLEYIYIVCKKFSEIIQPIHKILPTKVKDAAYKIPWLSSITKYFPLLKYNLQNAEVSNSNQKGKRLS